MSKFIVICSDTWEPTSLGVMLDGATTCLLRDSDQATVFDSLEDATRAIAATNAAEKKMKLPWTRFRGKLKAIPLVPASNAGTKTRSDGKAARAAGTGRKSPSRRAA